MGVGWVRLGVGVVECLLLCRLVVSPRVRAVCGGGGSGLLDSDGGESRKGREELIEAPLGDILSSRAVGVQGVVEVVMVQVGSHEALYRLRDDAKVHDHVRLWTRFMERL